MKVVDWLMRLASGTTRDRQRALALLEANAAWERERARIERICFEEPEVAERLLAVWGLTIDDVRRMDEPFPSLDG